MITRYVVDGQTAQTQTIKPLEFTLPGWVIPLLFGTFILGALVWTPIGRKIAVAPIAKGAKVSERKVESWMKKGDK